MDTGSLSLNSSLEAVNGPLLPVQYFEPIRQRKLLNGESRLLLAVLEDAMRSYLFNMHGSSREQKMEFAEVRNWFYAPEDDRQGLFAFGSICDLMGIDADMFRKRLASMEICTGPLRREPVHS